MSTGAGQDLVGLVGRLTLGTRGGDLPGEVELPIGGGSETYFAYSDDPIPSGRTVLVVAAHGQARVDVVAWVEPPSY